MGRLGFCGPGTREQYASSHADRFRFELPLVFNRVYAIPARSAAFLIVCLADISGARAYDVHIICTRLWPLRDAPRYQP